eukprot:TRINITY_DN25502_c0_g1_i1.p1 TRINITY_DN25502_c0_g1~~TRINITY_DN25502_c0_g1_i1.p1  ORF type:complete len:134 (+),score=31.23 TRINITY_DN25502_c0_g1_i1:44-445(+)
MAAEMLNSMHPNVVDNLMVPPTTFWGKSLNAGEKAVVGFEGKEVVLTNVALAGNGDEARLMTTTDCGTAILATLSEAVPHAKIWFRIKAGQQATISAKKGSVDVLGYTVEDLPDIDHDDIMPPINLSVDKHLS